MTQNKKEANANELWGNILKDHNIVERVKEDRLFHIKSDTIKEYKEPRLMAKWDSIECLPENLKKNHLNILPESRGSYIISDFLLYKSLPTLSESGNKISRIELPFDYETIDVNNISSEAIAVNVLCLTGALDDFLGVENNAATFNGRMGSGQFEFNVDTFRKEKLRIQVNNAQCEIDAGFENNESVVIMEAKKAVHEDFHVRQLYYPYRIWRPRVKKPIRLVFSVYSNMVFSLYEYRFLEIEDYSSIQLVQAKKYSLQDTKISLAALREVKERTRIVTDDNMDHTTIPFIQANSMERIISLLEILYQNPLTSLQIAEQMDFEPRQSDYYFNAGRYLGLFEKIKEDNQIAIKLTALGNQICKMNYKDRQLALVRQILEHQIFAEYFEFRMRTGELPDQKMITDTMRRLNVCAEGQIERRAGSVYRWLDWIFKLIKQ